MGLFNNYTKEGKGVSKDQYTPRFILFFQILFRKFWNLILINMLYFVFCISIVTIGPATAAMTKILRNYAREEHAFIWGDFIETFKNNLKQSLLYSLVDFLVVGFLFLDFIALYAVTDMTMKTICLAAILLAFTIWTFMRYYIYPMMVTFRLSFKQLIKNAFIFCWAGFFRNIFITAVLFAAFWGVFSLQSTSILIMLFALFSFYFSFTSFFTNFMVYPLIKKYMIDGFDPETGKRLEKEKYEGFEEKK